MRGCDIVPALVTVIMPFYNTSETKLRRAAESVLNQTYKNIELLLVDDGSEEKYALGESLHIRDNRIKLLRMSHAGVSAARNAALQISRGTWVAFADADDEVAPFFVEEALKVAVSTGADLAIGRARSVFAGDRILPLEDDANARVDVIRGPGGISALRDEMLGRFQRPKAGTLEIINRGPVAKLYRGSIARSNRFDESVSIGEDILYNFDCLGSCGTVVVTDATWYTYYQNAGSSLRQTEPRKWVSAIDGIGAHCIPPEFTIALDSMRCFVALQGAQRVIRSFGAGGRKAAFEIVRSVSPDVFRRVLSAGYRIPKGRKLVYEAIARQLYAVAFIGLYINCLLKRRKLLEEED